MKTIYTTTIPLKLTLLSSVVALAGTPTVGVYIAVHAVAMLAIATHVLAATPLQQSKTSR